MKTTIYIKSVIITLGLLLSVSCSEFLDEVPPSLISPETFFTTESEAEAAVLAGYSTPEPANRAVYGGFRDHGYEVWTDDWLHNAPNVFAPELAQFSWTPTIDTFDRMYSAWFYNISPLTNAIAGIESMEEFSRKSELLGEAKFLRAFQYFQLVRLFGRVPLIDKPLTGEDALSIPRAPVEDVYALIISDLTEAMASLPDTEIGNGRPTKWAATAELAKVHLTLENWSEAANLAIDVIQNSGKELLPNYRDIFLASNSNNNESIFEFQNTTGQITNQIASWPVSGNGVCDERSGGITLTGAQWGGTYIATQDLVNSFEPGDERYTFSSSYIDSQGNTIYFHRFRTCDYEIGSPDEPLYAFKRVSELYLERQEPSNGLSYNFIYTRLGEMYLIAAEGFNEASSGNPLQYLNPIRNRAGLADYAGATDQSSLRTAIRLERRHELYDERVRLYDLRRYSKADVTYMKNRITAAKPEEGALIENRHLLFPIGQNAVDSNPALSGDNNEGY